MKRLPRAARFLALFPAASLFPISAIAGQEPDLSALFPNRAGIRIEEAGLSRLDLPIEVIAECRPDLSDVRIVDAAGREVPYLVRQSPSAARPLKVERRLRVELLEATRETRERQDAPPIQVETYEIRAVGGFPGGHDWHLVLVSKAPRFVRRFRLEALAPGETGTAAVLEGTVFRFGAGREKSRISLLELLPGRMILTLEGEEGLFLDPEFRLEATRVIDPRERVAARLEELERHQEDGRTVVELERPPGVLPKHLEVATSTGSFDRRVEVWDEGPGSHDEAIGRGRIFRLEGLAGAEELRIPLRAPRGHRLRVTVDDGDSPPLADLGFSTALQGPALVFSLPGGERKARLLFGGGRALPPRYDLAGLAPSGARVEGRRALIAERLAEDPAEPNAMPVAVLGPIEENPGYDQRPVLAFAQRAGAELEQAPFSYRRSLGTASSREGLIRLSLGVEDLAVARPDLADLRIVDRESKQWAYLVEREAADEVHPLAITERVSKDGKTTYRLDLPSAPATLDEVVLDPAAPFFDRTYSLSAQSGDESNRLLAGRLSRRAGDPRPVRLAFSSRRVDGLTLEIDDGDDAPLAFRRIEARFPTPEIYFTAPEGHYHLLLGNPDAGSPSYELERVRNLVLSLKSVEAELGALEANPAFRRATRLATQKGLHKALLWAALAIALAVLAFFTLRLARGEG